MRRIIMKSPGTRPIVSSLLALAILATPAFADNPLTDADCEDAWTSSAASNSCGTASPDYDASVWVVDTSNFSSTACGWAPWECCAVTVDCAQDDNTERPKNQTFYGGLDQVASLVNCSSVLKENSC